MVYYAPHRLDEIAIKRNTMMPQYPKKTLPIICTLAIALAANFGTGCARKASTAHGTMNLRLSGEPNLLNPILTTDAYCCKKASACECDCKE